MGLKYETGNKALDAFRAFARYQTHGGYVWAAFFEDGELICERCARENYREIYKATRDYLDRSGWGIAGLTNSGECETFGACVQCNRTLWHGALQWFHTSSGRIEFQLSLDDAHTGHHSGRCDDDIADLLKVPYIAKQLEQIPAALLAAELKEYGAWDASELADHQANLARILWIACGDICDN